jgi:hypothetical protein
MRMKKFSLEVFVFFFVRNNYDQFKIMQIKVFHKLHLDHFHVVSIEIDLNQMYIVQYYKRFQYICMILDVAVYHEVFMLS